MSLGRDVHGASDQRMGDEAVIDGDDEERNDVEDQQGGGGVDLRVQPPGVGVGGAGHKGLVGAAGGSEGVQVREDGLGDGQGNGEDPDGSRSHAHAKPAAGLWHIQRSDDSFVAEQGIGDGQERFKKTLLQGLSLSVSLSPLCVKSRHAVQSLNSFHHLQRKTFNQELNAFIIFLMLDYTAKHFFLMI